MRFVLPILCLLICTLSSQAQESINVSGADLTGNNGTISYSIGQVFYHTNSQTDVSFAEGVQQPYEISTVSGIDRPDIVLRMSAYPNPTIGQLNLLIEDYDHEKLRYQLFDVDGKLLMEQAISQSNTQIDMVPFAMATYYLKILNDHQPIKSFKIIKA